MPQTRMFRDRVVSMEQTLEGGEKNLELLKALCREAMPEFTYREHSLDHERDLFVMVLEAPDGRTRKVSWTRMVLFDAERIPAVTGNPLGDMRGKILAFLKARAARPEIVVTFRHLEEGWVDTPEPRRDRRRRRGRGDRGRREGRREAGERPPDAAGRGQPAPSGHPMAAKNRRPQGPPQAAAPSQGAPQGAAGGAAPGGGAGRRRRRMRRRRRGRGPGGGSPQGPASPPGAP